MLIYIAPSAACIIIINTEPSPPLNLTFTFSSTLSTVTISWVAPLDTPLCVHSYTVTVRNSCNSSQVMVYNTTDNRSSLSITDLTSDGEYSVTVASRDGAGRLGQESEELSVILNGQLLCITCMHRTYYSCLQLRIFVSISSQNSATWLHCPTKQCFISVEGIFTLATNANHLLSVRTC